MVDMNGADTYGRTWPDIPFEGEDADTMDYMLDLYVDVNAEKFDVNDLSGFDETRDTRSECKVEDADEAEDDDSSGDEGPRWLRLSQLEDTSISADAEGRADYIESLHEDSLIGDLDGVCTQLVQYLIGHPTGLISRKRKFPGGKGSKSRYFGEERSEDVMADKVVTGCWACGKLTHVSENCEFKRCFLCSGQGHEIADCTRKNERCKNCNKQGHDQDECPDVEYCAGLKAQLDSFFCRCINCGEEGHVNCKIFPTRVVLTPRLVKPRLGNTPQQPAEPPQWIQPNRLGNAPKQPGEPPRWMQQSRLGNTSKQPTVPPRWMQPSSTPPRPSIAPSCWRPHPRVVEPPMTPRRFLTVQPTQSQSTVVEPPMTPRRFRTVQPIQSPQPQPLQAIGGWCPPHVVQPWKQSMLSACGGAERIKTEGVQPSPRYCSNNHRNNGNHDDGWGDQGRNWNNQQSSWVGTWGRSHDRGFGGDGDGWDSRHGHGLNHGTHYDWGKARNNDWVTGRRH